MRFFSPKDKSHVSHSIVNLQETEDYFEARCMTLRRMCGWLHLQQVRLQKVDIEGAQYEVLRSVTHAQTACVQFHIETNIFSRANAQGYFPSV